MFDVLYVDVLLVMYGAQTFGLCSLEGSLVR